MTNVEKSVEESTKELAKQFLELIEERKLSKL